MRKLSIMLAMVLLVTTLLCGAAAAETKINFWAGFTGADKQGMEGIVALFEKQNPDIDVEFYSVPWTELFTKFAASFGTDSGPDIMIMHATDIPNYSELGMLSTLEDVATELGISADDYSASVWAGNTYNGSQWGIPLDYHPMGVYKNVAAFEAAGLDPNMSFDSAEVFLDACKKLTVKDASGNVTQYALGIGSDHAHTMRYWYSLLYQAGGSFLDEGNEKAVFADEAGVKALQYLADLVHVEGVVPYHESDIDADFLSGRIAMVIEGPWFVPAMRESSIAYTTCPFPQIFENQAVWAGSHTLTIPAFSASAERADAGKKLLKFIVENSIEWGKGGQIPASFKVVSSDAYKALDEYAQFKAFIDQAEFVHFEPLIPKTSELGADNQLSPVLNAVYVPIRGDGAAADALAEAAAATDRILAE